MPTRKQRRRQQKSRRHEYEYVYVDAEGREVEVDADELDGSASRATKQKDKEKPRSASSRAAPARAARGGRTIEPPSWRRVLRRTLFMAPVIVLAIMLLGRDLPLGARLAQAAFLLLIFVPFSYFTDSLAYRMYRKRLDRTGSTGRGRA